MRALGTALWQVTPVADYEQRLRSYGLLIASRLRKYDSLIRLE
ncbi:hypothetical protein ACFPES_10395 [Paenibacillus sp. GCM10023248]|nr:MULTISPECIES: hypothetical protein [Bacillales]MDD9267432.1 hypothetical protein [Paenibacillus sp. MAHUQ-63]MDR6882649.1 hypothetical protein [Bacillus sp. 3255]